MRYRHGRTDQIRAVTPGAKVVTVQRLIQTQRKLLRSLRTYGLLLAVIVVLVAGTQIANHTALSVRLRSREIATFGAIGATPRQIGSLFTLQAAALGLVGAVLGCLVAALGAAAVGQAFLHTPGTLPARLWLALSAGGVVGSVLFAAVPSRAATRWDPALLLEE